MKPNISELSGLDFFKMSWSILAGIAARLQTRQFRVQIPIGARVSPFSTTSIPGLGPTLSPIQWVLGFFPGSKAVGAWSYTTASPLCTRKTLTVVLPLSLLV